MDRVRPRRAGHRAARCGPTTCSASAVRRTTLAQVTVRDERRPRARPRHGLRHPGAARVAALARGSSAPTSPRGRSRSRGSTPRSPGSTLRAARGARCSSRSPASGSTSSSATRRSSSRRATPGVPVVRVPRRRPVGDAIVRELVEGVGARAGAGRRRAAARQLGGAAAARSGTSASGAWLDASGLDGWVVQRELQDPAQYAETWIRDGGTTPDRDRAAWAARYGAWLDDFASRDVEAIGFGFVTLRRPRPGAPTLRRLEEVTGTGRQPLGPADRRVARARTTGSAGTTTTASPACASSSPPTSPRSGT